jgi:pyruvate dehydrogenase complex dehydrogenase (E1) component
LLEEGITEAGAMSSWIAAATSYSVHGVAMLPVYIYYSMFGFQRVGDLIWCAADSRTKGFLVGGTSGRTTLNGEGLQHQDGHSQLAASAVPNIVAYDPAYAYELAVIIQDVHRPGVDLLLPVGLQRTVRAAADAGGAHRGDSQGDVQGVEHGECRRLTP